MTLKQIQKRVEEDRPFRRLAFHLDNGNEYSLTHPENIQYLIDGSVLLRYDTDEFVWLNPSVVSAITFKRRKPRRKS